MKVDTHSHAIPQGIMDLYHAQPMEYNFRLQTAADGSLEMIGKSGIVTPLRKGFYDVPARLADMDARGVDAELVTPSPTTVFYDWPLEKALPFMQTLNDGIAEMCREAPDRLFPAASLPMQDVDASCEELKRVVKQYGIRMVMLNTSVNGLFYDDPSFFPLFSLCEELDVMVFIHPQSVKPGPGLEKYYLINLLGNPIDSTISAARLVLGGAMKQFPGCRFYFAHGGGCLPYQRGRVEHGYDKRKEPRVNLGEDELAPYFDRLYFDTITHSPKALAFLISSHGADHVLLGSDYPFDMADMRSPEEILALEGLDSEEKEQIFSANIMSLLK